MSITRFLIRLFAALLATPLSLLATRAEAGQEYPSVVVDVAVWQDQGKVVKGAARGHELRIDQPTVYGGSDTAATPPETFAFALGACLVSSLRFIAELENTKISNIRARVVGNLNFSRVMGGAGRAGFLGLTLYASFDAPWDEGQKMSFLRRVSERCPIYDNVLQETSMRLVLDKGE
ncbi:MAG: OsmC family protein [Desulfocurvibacter africanus]